MFNAYGATESTVITTLYDAIAEGYDGSEDLPSAEPFAMLALMY